MFDKEAAMLKLRCGNDQYPRVLEQKYPHILKKILELWGKPDADIYITDLLQPNGRSGGRLDRDGFPPDAAAEIFRLGTLHRNIFSKRR